MERIEIKRKEFEVVEKLGEHTLKVTRKGKFYVLKEFPSQEAFDSFIENEHRLRMSAIEIPKMYLFEKHKLISVVEFIDGENMFDSLMKQKLENELVYDLLMRDEFYMKHEKFKIDLAPENFIFTGKKLVYWTFSISKLDSKYSFVNSDFKLWFDTNELADYAAKKGIVFDRTRIKNDYLTNKEMALMAVKYYQ